MAASAPATVTAVEHAFSDSRSLDLYLPQPASAVALPLLVFIHGGAWVSRSKAEFVHIGRTWASRGWPTAIIDYELSPEKHSDNIHPMHVRDCARAIAWYCHLNLSSGCGFFAYGSRLRLREDASYDRDRIVLVGHSAGAFMSALLAFDPTFLLHCGSASPESFLVGLVGLNGIYDVPLLSGNYPKYAEVRRDLWLPSLSTDGFQWFLEFAFGNDREFWRTSYPTAISSPACRTVPWLTVHSTEVRRR
jgi:acetyl esterase/lipase